MEKSFAKSKSKRSRKNRVGNRKYKVPVKENKNVPDKCKDEETNSDCSQKESGTQKTYSRRRIVSNWSRYENKHDPQEFPENGSDVSDIRYDELDTSRKHKYKQNTEDQFVKTNDTVSAGIQTRSRELGANYDQASTSSTSGLKETASNNTVIKQEEKDLRKARIVPKICLLDQLPKSNLSNCEVSHLKFNISLNRAVHSNRSVHPTEKGYTAVSSIKNNDLDALLNSLDI